MDILVKKQGTREVDRVEKEIVWFYFLRNRGWVKHNPTKPVCEVRIVPTYKRIVMSSLIQYGTL